MARFNRLYVVRQLRVCGVIGKEESNKVKNAIGWKIQIHYLDKRNFLTTAEKDIMVPNDKILVSTYIKWFDTELINIEKEIWENLAKYEELSILIKHLITGDIITKISFSGGKAYIYSKSSGKDDGDSVSMEEGKKFLLRELENIKNKVKDYCRQLVLETS